MVLQYITLINWSISEAWNCILLCTKVKLVEVGMKTVGIGRKTSQSFSTSTFEYENENESGKAGHENEHELTEYQKFRKRTNSSGIMSNTIGIRKINTKY